MTILIAGGSGFLGTVLRRALHATGQRVIVLSRRPQREGEVRWAPDGSDTAWIQTLNDVDAVINLAGESIAGGRWTAARKAAIRDSRMQATRALASAISAVTHAPRVFLSASAMGFYGVRGDEPLTESSPGGSDFLADVCREWEATALGAASHCRVVLLRTGLVLARNGGALPQMALPFRFFAGGPVGTGRQYMSWISVADWVGILVTALATESYSGPINLTAPAPVTNAEFARMLGRVLGRPSFMPAPAFALRLILGEMADALVLGGQRVLPERALALGYTFKHRQLEPALRAIYS